MRTKSIRFYRWLWWTHKDRTLDQGVFKQTVQLSSGKFALVENAHEFTLVPWRPVIENRLGCEVMGVVQHGSVSWQFGRKLGLGL